MKNRLHAIAGTVALLCVASFWTATAVSELLLDARAVAAVKQGIVYGMWLLIPALAATGGSGFLLARGRTGQLLTRKQRRMPIIAANGLLILLPSALFLNAKAAAGGFDTAFYAVQGLELIAGALNLLLLLLNARDGLRLAGRLRRR